MRGAATRRLLLAAALLLAAPAARGVEAPQALVDRATLAAEEMLLRGDPGAAEQTRAALRRARAALICPQVFRAGFFLGGEGGGCVLIARDAAGSWTSPAFYSLASASFGLQFGVQDMKVMMLVMSDRALSAVLDSQFKLGADLSLALATVGAGVEGATTAAAGADLLVVARGRGLFAGLALEGTLLSAESGLNRAYYGREVGPRQILLAMEAHNPASDPLRAVLTRHGAPAR